MTTSSKIPQHGTRQVGLATGAITISTKGERELQNIFLNGRLQDGPDSSLP
jgi:hypothetical protein